MGLFGTLCGQQIRDGGSDSPELAFSRLFGCGKLHILLLRGLQIQLRGFRFSRGVFSCLLFWALSILVAEACCGSVQNTVSVVNKGVHEIVLCQKGKSKDFFVVKVRGGDSRSMPFVQVGGNNALYGFGTSFPSCVDVHQHTN